MWGNLWMNHERQRRKGSKTVRLSCLQTAHVWESAPRILATGRAARLAQDHRRQGVGEGVGEAKVAVTRRRVDSSKDGVEHEQ